MFITLNEKINIIFLVTKILFLTINYNKMSLILTYNVNGIRGALKKDFDSWINHVSRYYLFTRD